MPLPLLNLLSNSLVLRQTAPYLDVRSILALSATSRDFRTVLYTSRDAFRHLDLSPIKSAAIDSAPIDTGGISWRAERMDEGLTEDEFYSGPLMGIFSKLARKQVLRNVSILILDGLSVPADMIKEIITEDRFNVRILSIREAKHLNERKLRQTLRYAVRPTRPAGTPRLKGMYVFGLMDSATPQPSHIRERPPTQIPTGSGVMYAQGAQIG
ncbi:hypothetical protein LTS18_006627, partial [Coniosporium uncinatum]